MIACVLIQDGTFGYFLVQNTAKQLPKSKKTVVFGIHRLTTDAGTPLYLRYCIPPKREEASDARIYLCVRHGRETTDANQTQETCE